MYHRTIEEKINITKIKLFNKRRKIEYKFGKTKPAGVLIGLCHWNVQSVARYFPPETVEDNAHNQQTCKVKKFPPNLIIKYKQQKKKNRIQSKSIECNVQPKVGSENK